MVFAYMPEKMERDLKDNGSKVWRKDMESIIGLTESVIKGNISSIIAMEKEFYITVKNKNILVNGKMDTNRDKESIKHKTKKWMGYGLKEIYLK